MKMTSASCAGMSTLLASLALLSNPRDAMAFDPPKDPCSVLTTEQVSAALEGKVTAGEHVVATLCEWKPADQTPGARPKRLTLGFLSASAWEQTKAPRATMRSITRSPVEGLGEEAVFSSSPVTCTLQVKKGAAVLDIHLYGVPPDQAKIKEIALARSALAKF
ncbi:MAG TPA: hypothetical protein VGV09_13430 [Steroidobacteraceae bacterium]|nr:hypothetical protein [Steroidobacteraceae bacterium]